MSIQFVRGKDSTARGRQATAKAKFLEQRLKAFVAEIQPLHVVVTDLHQANVMDIHKLNVPDLQKIILYPTPKIGCYRTLKVESNTPPEIELL